MNRTKTLTIALLAVAVFPVTSVSLAAEFFLRADVTTKTMPDGQAIPMWGFAQDSAFDANDGVVTVPGPILTVPPGDTTLIIHLKNNLTPARTGLAIGSPVSLVIPGQVTPMTPVRFGPTPYPEFEGRVRSLTQETQPGNTTPVDYVWNNFKPGTFVYHSGTHIQCHIQMGLYGGVTKDYAAAPYKQAYPGVIYETSVPVFFSEIDPAFHQAVDVAQATIDATGQLTASLVSADTPAVISAQYSLAGVTVTDTHNITIVNGSVLPPEVIVDNLSAGTSSTGSWFVSGATNPWATNSMASLTLGSTFTFTANLAPGTTYAVYGWWTGGGNRYTAVPYDIADGATMLDTVTVDQFVNGGQWNLLGTYPFTGAASVTIRAVVGFPSSTCADAVRFVPVP